MEPFNWEKSLISFITDGRQLLTEMGSDNMSNALKAINAVIADRERWKKHCEEICEITGTVQIGNAKQKIKKLVSGATPDDLSKLPEAFHRPPAIWLTGKKKTLLIEGFAPMGPRDAERKHRVILPLLMEVWELSEGDEEERLAIEKAYRNWSADDLERELYLTINKLEEPTLEDLLEERVTRQEAEFENWQKGNSEAREKRAKKRSE